MSEQVQVGAGCVVRLADLTFNDAGDGLVARAVGAAQGARMVALDVVRVPAGRRYVVDGSEAEENNAVVFAGAGAVKVGAQTRAVQRGSAAHAPAGSVLAAQAGDEEELTLYVWRSSPATAQPPLPHAKRFGALADDEYQLVGFTGYGGVEPGWRAATMNFVFWPGSGSTHLCLHCGIQQPGEAFAVHIHPHSEEAFIVFEGGGQLFLEDAWIDAEAGDILFAPPGVRHGARNHQRGAAAPDFVTCGGPTPFDPVLYQRAGLSPEVQ
jgi:quercetin dioxygenase-like cupin family protein